jgi:hypothetical protein
MISTNSRTLDQRTMNVIYHTTNRPAVPAFDAARFPVLARLRLTTEDAQALARQGFVSSETRSQRKVFRLRYRRDGRQHVRCIPSAATARQVQAELVQLQAPVRRRRRLARLARESAAAVRDAIERIKPVLASNGYHLYGREVRKHRKQNYRRTV